MDITLKKVEEAHIKMGEFSNLSTSGLSSSSQGTAAVGASGDAAIADAGFRLSPKASSRIRTTAWWKCKKRRVKGSVCLTSKKLIMNHSSKCDLQLTVRLI
jgi:hypothetical protein